MNVEQRRANSRQKWFSERLGIEAISRDIGSPNLFVTVNLDPRAWPDVRRLIYKLEHGEDMVREEPFEKNTAQFILMHCIAALDRICAVACKVCKMQHTMSYMRHL